MTEISVTESAALYTVIEDFNDTHKSFTSSKFQDLIEGWAKDVIEARQPQVHGMVRHPIGAAELLVGSGNQGSASCLCGTTLSLR